MILLSDIDVLVRAGESYTVEFKTSFNRETIESLVAFANAQGGTVLIGIADDGSVCGVTIGKETLNDWLGQVKSATSPSIIPDIGAFQVEGRTVVAIQVGEYPVKPINTRGRYFKRIAGANHQLSLSEITDLYMQSLQLSWDAYEAPRESLTVCNARNASPTLCLPCAKPCSMPWCIGTMPIPPISRSRSLTTGSHSSVRANSTGGSP